MKESAFNHQTIFIPYYSESKESQLDNLCATFAGQIGLFGKKRGVRSQRKLNDYIQEKIDRFMGEKADTPVQ